MVENILCEALKLAQDIKFFVEIQNNEIREMSYFELGIYLTNHADLIESVKINLKG